MTEAPLLSVCMISYNHEKFIEKALKSVLIQKTNFYFEIVISDDCSQDNSFEILKYYKEKYPNKINLIQNENNIGMTENFIKAMKNCKGKYIAMLDSDDYWIDDHKLQKQLDFLEANPEYGLVCTDIKVVDESDYLINWSPLDDLRKRYKSGFIFFDLLSGSTINSLTACFRKELINELFSKKDNWYMEDWWWWLRISMKSKIKYIDSKSACYRRHSSNYTREENLRTDLKNKINYLILYDTVIYFHDNNKNELSKDEKEIFFRSILRLLFRKYGTLKMKLKVFPLFFLYYSGHLHLFNLLKKRFFPSINFSNLTSRYSH